MNTKTIVNTATLAVLLAGGLPFLAHAEAPAAKLTPEAFRAKLKKDDSALPNGGDILMSYAGVAQKILPSVVRITAYGSGKENDAFGFNGGGGGRGGLPPEMRDFLRRYFGLPEGGDDKGGDQFGGGGGGGGNDDDQGQRPRGRGRGKAPRANPHNEDQKMGTGSGVIITTDGYILTNNHVVADSSKLEVNVGSETKTYQARIIGHDPLTDVAVIKIDGVNLPAAVIGDSSKLRVGDVVLAAGNPMNLSQSLTHGIVSAMGRVGMGIVHDQSHIGFENFIQTDASINPGNSGGPLVDGMGRVVGINTAIMTQSGMSAGIGFSIPINMVLSVGEDLINGGKVSRGFLGIKMKNLDVDAAKALGVGDSGGVLVESVVPGSPAQKSGIQEGDVIVSAGGQHVENVISMRSVVGVSKPGSKMLFEVIRDSKPLSLNVTLGGASDEDLAQGTAGRGGKPEEKADEPAAAPTKIIPGVTLQELTAATRERYDVAKNVSGGVVVIKVDANTPAAGAGLEEGDVIISINSHPVATLAQASATTKGDDKVIGLRVRRKSEPPIFIMVRKDGAGG